VAEVAAADLAVAQPVAGWTFTFSAVALRRLSATVLHADGSAPAAGVTVMVASSALPAVGTLSDGAGGAWPAVGHIRRTLVSDSAGQLVDPERGGEQRLPVGSYELTLIPPASATEEGRRIVAVALDDDARLDLRLAERGIISGEVFAPSGERVRAEVTARGPSGEFAASTDDEGRFTLAVDDRMRYALVVRARAGAAEEPAVGPLLLPDLQVAGATRLDKLILPRAVGLAGRVVTKGGLAVAGAQIRIWCSGAGCAARDIVDEGLTAADGSFSLRVPPP
jgi:hypothetical protein